MSHLKALKCQNISSTIDEKIYRANAEKNVASFCQKSVLLSFLKLIISRYLALQYR